MASNSIYTEVYQPNMNLYLSMYQQYMYNI